MPTAGTVPVKYITASDDPEWKPGVVPIETVLVMAAGVVPVHEDPVGLDNIVNVREADAETPRVKVLKV